MKKYKKQLNRERTKLIHEAIAITRDLGEVIFIGAVAVFLHTKSGRESQDLDIVIATPLSDQQLNENGYSKYPEGGKEAWKTPRQYKIDIYRDWPINKIPLSTIANNTTYVTVKNTAIKVVSLEMLILMKCKASRDKDHEDLFEIAKQKFRVIDWKKLKSISESETQYYDIHSTMQLYNTKF